MLWMIAINYYPVWRGTRPYLLPPSMGRATAEGMDEALG
jgi:hypothetical protein